MSLAGPDLEKSGLMNDSDFINGDDIEKLQQMKLIADITKDSSKYEAFMKERMLCLKPIINYWKQGRINNALDLVQSYMLSYLDPAPQLSMTLPLQYSLTLASSQPSHPKSVSP